MASRFVREERDPPVSPEGWGAYGHPVDPPDFGPGDQASS